MGILGKLKERYSASRAYGRPAPKAEVGIDLDEDRKFMSETRQAMRSKEKDDDTQGGLFESKKERSARIEAKRQERKKKIHKVYNKINSGFDKYEKGKKKVGKMFDQIGGMLPNEGSSRGRGGSSFGGGFGGLSQRDINELAGLGGGPRSSGDSRKRKGSSRRGLVPVYQGSRVVGYVKGGGARKKKSSRRKQSNPFGINSIDLGF